MNMKETKYGTGGNSPVKAEIASSNLVGVANISEVTRMLREIVDAMRLEHIDVDTVFDILNSAQDLEEARELLDRKVNIELLTLREAAEYSGITYGTIANWASEGRLPRIGKRKVTKGLGRAEVLVSKNDLDDILANPPRAGRQSGWKRGRDFEKNWTVIKPDGTRVV